MLVVMVDEPFGYVRYDAQFRKALDMQDIGGAIQILPERRIAELSR